ncbi:hypothetical protein M8C21_002901 [Ambrosia artemisiifolia]|uniref:Uncharacterized protein n=1 Tax=Ambrosia artemisiifolia TaxID=4212 RepID=A0AAD5C9J4_AMBAR|nr:hypothetical protein M8C21_002901 [Ambrosia artemisiifolia]
MPAKPSIEELTWLIFQGLMAKTTLMELSAHIVQIDSYNSCASLPNGRHGRLRSLGTRAALVTEILATQLVLDFRENGTHYLLVDKEMKQRMTNKQHIKKKQEQEGSQVRIYSCRHAVANAAGTFKIEGIFRSTFQVGTNDSTVRNALNAALDMNIRILCFPVILDSTNQGTKGGITARPAGLATPQQDKSINLLLFKMGWLEQTVFLYIVNHGISVARLDSGEDDKGASQEVDGGSLCMSRPEVKPHETSAPAVNGGGSLLARRSSNFMLGSNNSKSRFI